MSDIKSIRESLGMSQALFASFLGMTRPTLALVETRRRTMPADAMIKLGLLLNTLATVSVSPSAKAISTLEKQAQEHRNLMGKHLQRCSLQADSLSSELEAMQEQYNQCMQALKVSSHVLSNSTNAEPENMDKETMALLEQEALRKMEECGPGAQAILSLRIMALNYQVSQAQNLVF